MFDAWSCARSVAATAAGRHSHSSLNQCTAFLHASVRTLYLISDPVKGFRQPGLRGWGASSRIRGRSRSRLYAPAYKTPSLIFHSETHNSHSPLAHLLYANHILSCTDKVSRLHHRLSTLTTRNNVLRPPSHPHPQGHRAHYALRAIRARDAEEGAAPSGLPPLSCTWLQPSAAADGAADDASNGSSNGSADGNVQRKPAAGSTISSGIRTCICTSSLC